MRLLAFYIIPWEQYAANDLDGFLVSAMQMLNKMTRSKLEELKNTFCRTMKVAFDIFGNDAFHKRFDTKDGRNPVNKALLEIWCVGLARCPEEDLNNLIRRKQRIRNSAMELLQDDQEFEIAISASTGVPQRVKKRFGEINTFIAKCLQ